MTAHRFVSFCTVAALALQTLAAHSAPKDSSGDTDPNKERREWMNRGNAEYVQKHWETARDYYRNSWDIKHHYTIAANLADVEMKLGHYAEAVAYLKYALANIPETKLNERKLAEDQLAECKDHLTAVRVATDVTDATVLVDGRDVGQTPLREDLLLEPGKHVLSVTKPGYGGKTEELSAVGNQLEVTITLERVSAQTTQAPQAPLSSVASSRRPERKSGKTSDYQLGSYVAFGVGAAGIGLGTYLALKAHNTQSQSDSQFATCLPRCGSAAQASIADLDQSAKGQRLVSTVSFILGGVGIATGVTLLVAEPRQSDDHAAAHVRPWIGLGQAGIAGSF